MLFFFLNIFSFEIALSRSHCATMKSHRDFSICARTAMARCWCARAQRAAPWFFFFFFFFFFFLITFPFFFFFLIDERSDFQMGRFIMPFLHFFVTSRGDIWLPQTAISQTFWCDRLIRFHQHADALLRHAYFLHWMMMPFLMKQDRCAYFFSCHVLTFFSSSALRPISVADVDAVVCAIFDVDWCVFAVRFSFFLTRKWLIDFLAFFSFSSVHYFSCGAFLMMRYHWLPGRSLSSFLFLSFCFHIFLLHFRVNFFSIGDMRAQTCAPIAPVLCFSAIL